ncbi:MAG: Fic family protein [Propionibacteriaceae bacterium]|nr:Fic family protein [Propionibacteriaceae bacterium]
MADSELFRLTPDWLKAQNAAILRGLEVEDHVVPGEYTTARLVVGRYRGAPPADVPYLVERLCDWLNGFLAIVGDPARPDDDRFVYAFLTAVLGHLYVAWIHPFGDGNGRVARALECAVLANSGIVPWVAADLLSNHYNATRSLYYHRLDQASRLPEGEGVAEFVRYAAEGFVDHLRDQLAQVQSMQRRIAWESFIHEIFRSQTQGEASRRRRALVLALPEDTPVPPSRMRRLTPELAEAYAGKTQKTVSHDVNRLKRLGLIVGPADGGYRANTTLMSAFLPPVRRLADQS